ncbi:MAG: 4-hydroxyphenylpyruvate dioxygenase [Oceanospirillaceae bacterium]|nr:4-hydroxyphenylpyruvate dioxygenase [Oceanospirillaceae bacterium]
MSNRPSATDNRPGAISIEFVEFAAPDPAPLAALFEHLGFRAAARHRSKDVTLYQQGEINFIINATPGSFAQGFAAQHGPSICALALRVPDATRAYQQLLDQGAWEATTSAGAMELNIPAIESIGGTQVYLVDRFGEDLSIYDVDFHPLQSDRPEQPELQRLSSLVLSVCAGRGDEWRDFFCRLFGFEAIDACNLKSPDGSFQLEIREGTAAGLDLTDEGIGALRLTSADPARLCHRLKQAGIDPIPAGDGDIQLKLPVANAAFDLIIGH